LSPGAELRGEEQIDLFAAMGDVASDFHRLTTEGIEPTLNVFIDQVTRMTDTLENVAATNIQPFFETLQKNIEDPVIWNDAKKLLTSLNKTVDNMNRFLGDENQQHISGMLQNFESMSENMNQLTRRIEKTRREIHNAASQLNKLVVDNSDSVSKTISASRVSAEELHITLTTVSEHINTVMYDLEGTMRNLHEFSREIRENPRLLISGSPQDDHGNEQ
jgi:phospholipid/cholesterol/gamma-HCH transport system substrate-binding protein